MDVPKIYFAPMEGITTYIYRNNHHEFYRGIDKYFMPFVSANHTMNFQTKEKKDFSPDNNQNINVIPQILTKKADEFVWAVKQLSILGYDEINFNLGCPAGTVVSKGKGSGFLAFPEKIDEFLYQVFDETANTDVKISLKVRAGRYEHSELDHMMDIYNKYPIYELIIHPRVQKEMYRNKPDYNAFINAFEKAKMKVVYNGDINSLSDYKDFKIICPDADTIMLGRGLIKNPELSERIKLFEDINDLDIARLKRFHDRIFFTYLDEIGEHNSIMKMKELWCYMGEEFPQFEKELKGIKKTNKMSEYLHCVGRILGSKQ